MEDLKDKVRQAVANYNRHDLEAFLAQYADDAELTGASGTFKGHEAIRQHWAEGLTAFPDIVVTIDRLLADGDTVVAEYHVSGTNSGPLRLPTGETIPATNKRVTCSAVDIVTYRGGKVTSQREYLDQVPVLAQLGLMPAPAGAAA